MPNPPIRRTEALKILGLGEDGTHTKRAFDLAYRRLARTLHPDKGGTAEQFQALSEAYQVMCQSLEHPIIGNVSLSVEEALATLYTTLSSVEDKLSTYSASNTIFLHELRAIFCDIQFFLRSDILNDSPKEVVIRLRFEAKKLNGNINTIYSGPTPAFAGMLGGVFVTILLGIVALMIAFSLPAGVVLGTAALSGLIATPPVGGLLFGTFCFFTASNADKNRSEQQQEMRRIVTAINALADALSTPEENEENRVLGL